MNAGLKTSFQYLARTQNVVAVEILMGALDCPYAETREGAIRALLERPDPAGHLEVFGRLSRLDSSERAIVGERPERLVGAAGQAVKDARSEVCAMACEAILNYRLYEVLPALLSLINAGTHTEKDRLAKTVLRLVESFYAELSIPEKQGRRKDADSLRQRLTASLEEAVKKFPQHRSMEVVESLVLVAKPQNVSLRYLLQQPGSETHDAVVEVLTQSTRGGVIRMLLAFLEDPLMPQAVRKVLVGRSDVKFVEHLSLFVGSKPSKAVVETLPQFDGFAWATADAGVLVQLSEQAQAYAVNVLTGSGMKAPARQEALGALLLEGKPAGRRAAAQALADIESPEANALVVRALTDEDGEVRAQAIRQLRARKIPGALSLLIRMVGSTEEPIREALREALPEFSFRQFLASLDSLDERSAQTVGQVVRWIDRDPVSQLIQEMKHLSPVRRRRATQAADAMNMVSAVEPQVIELLNDDDHVVRQAAAKALADCGTQPSWEALRDALLDRSVIVQEAAEHSLERLSSLLSNEVKQTELVEAAR